MVVKVLGTGCKRCHELYDNAKKITDSLKNDVTIKYVTDLEEIVSYGVMQTPALVVDEKVVSVGKVLKPNEIEVFLSR